MKAKLPVVVVKRKNSKIVGQLYFKTTTHIVLLNNVVQQAELGRLRQIRKRHIDPEANVIVIPRADVEWIAVVGTP
jgi:hypothetical protein